MLEQLKKEIEAFENVQSECRQWGAEDTASDCQFQNKIGDAMRGAKWVHLDADGWKLHSGVAGADLAAAKLNAAAKRVCDHILQNDINRYLDDYCWRWK
jgi:hypothetical protein